MATEIKMIGNAQVIRDTVKTWRWYDAFGPGVVKFVTSFASMPADDQTTRPTEWANTVVNTSSAVLADVAGGALLFTTDNAENDGFSMQLGNPNLGRWLSLAAQYPTYFCITFKVNDADQTDCFFGAAVTDTALLGGVTDGIYIRSVDETAVLYFVLEKDSVETATAIATLADDTYVTIEFSYIGGNMNVYVNGTLATTIADTDANFPNDELLRLSMEFLTGEAVANTCTVKELRLIQIQ